MQNIVIRCVDFVHIITTVDSPYLHSNMKYYIICNPTDGVFFNKAYLLKRRKF